MIPLFRRVSTWVVLGALGLACAAVAFTQFDRVFFLIHIPITVDRQGAQGIAAELASRDGIGPTDARSAAFFSQDHWFLTYVDFVYGKKTLAKTEKEDIYHPFVWKVRHFNPKQIHQAYFYILPDGRPYGFEETISDQLAYQNLEESDALALAHQVGANAWRIDWTRYVLLNTNRNQAVNGRVDYEFVFRQRQSVVDPMAIRLVIRVQGKRVTAVQPRLELPEVFETKYVALRSINDVISGMGFGLAFLLYGVGGLGFGLWYLRVLRLLHWRPALLTAGFLSSVIVVEMINRWPMQWFFYQTTQTAIQFYLEFASDLIVTGLFWMAVLSLSFAVGEGLTRVAFPRFISFWKLGRPDIANTPDVAGQTLGGYVAAMFHLAYVVIFYVVATRVLGWWVPSELDTDPNILVSYVPAFSALAGALQAGIWEEVVFRAIPIGGAALIGRRLGYPRSAMALAWVAQAAIFAACHANYPGFPGYSRLIELMLPALLFGALYIRFGLLPAIVAHTVYDLILMALPVMMLQSAWGWMNKAIVMVALLVPFVFLSLLRWRAGRWQAVDVAALNLADRIPAPMPVTTPIIVSMGDEPISRRWIYGGAIAGIIGIMMWIGWSPRQPDAPLVTVSKSQAIQQAKNVVRHMGVNLDSSWQLFSYWNADPGVEDDFVWQTTSPATYRALIGRGLEGPHWEISFKRFNVPTVDRQETIFVTVGARGLSSFYYQLPETRKGVHLSAMDAVSRVRDYLPQTGLGSGLRQVGIDSQQFSDRTDWTLTFADGTVRLPQQAQRRLEIKVSGNTIVRQLWTLDLPQGWQRQEESRRHFQDLARTFSMLAMIAGTLSLWLILMKRQNRPTGKSFLMAMLVIGVMALIAVLSDWPQSLAQFSPLRPLRMQYSILAISSALKIAFTALAGASLWVWVIGEKPTSESPWHWILPTGGLWMLLSGLSVVFWTRYTGPLPLWADQSALNRWFPLAGTATETALVFVFGVGLLGIWVLGLAVVDSRLPSKWVRIPLWFLIGAACAAFWEVTTVSEWLVWSTMAALSLACLFYLGFRRHLRAFVIVIAASMLEYFALNAWWTYHGHAPQLFRWALASVVCLLLTGFALLRVRVDTVSGE